MNRVWTDGPERLSRLSRRRLLQLSGGALLSAPVVGLLAACGGSSAPSAASTASSAGTTATQATTSTGSSSGSPTARTAGSPAASPGGSTTSANAAAPNGGLVPANVKPGGSLVVAIGTDISALEPQQSTETSSTGVRINLYDTLVWVETPQWTPLPWLASKWDIAPDGKTYTFTLTDKPVKFHDGTDFNADAVKATFDRLFSEQHKTSAAAINMNFIDKTEVVDPKTVRFTMNKAFAPAMIRFGTGAAAIISPAAIEKYGEDYNSHPIGTGPYKFVEYRKGDHAAFEKFTDYWNGPVMYDKLTYKIVPEDASRATLVQTGEAQVADRIPPVLAQQFQGNKDAKLKADATSRFVFMVLNQNRDLMKNVKVRQAVNYGVDNESLVKNILRGYADVPNSPIPKVAKYYKPQTPYSFDLNKAKSLLQEAGVAAGTPLVIWTPQGRYAGDKDMATAVQGMMNNLGFNATVRVVGDFPTYLKELDTLDYDMAIWGWVSPDPDIGLNQLYSSRYVKVFPNWGSYSNPKVDDLLTTAGATLDEAKAADLYGQAQQIIWQEAASLWLDWQQNLTGLSAKIDGVYDDLSEVLIVRFSGFTG